MQGVNSMIVCQGPFHDTVFATELKINGAEHKSKGRAMSTPYAPVHLMPNRSSGWTAIL